MPRILREHDNCRLYVKNAKGIDARYFVSEKSANLRRLQISENLSGKLMELHAHVFMYAVAEALNGAKSMGLSAYYEVAL